MGLDRKNSKEMIRGGGGEGRGKGDVQELTDRQIDRHWHLVGFLLFI